MAKIFTAEKFQRCQKGTAFACGPRWAFGSMLILDEIIGPFENGAWGFYATDPIWVDSNDFDEAFDVLEEMWYLDVSAPINTSSTKYMSYDGDEMEVFLVLEASDWAALTAMTDFSASALSETKGK